MFCRIEALNFRCLRYINQELGSFHVLVGPNASGKTTFMDVVAFVSEIVSEDIESAITSRTGNFIDLVWSRSNDLPVEFALEAELPDFVREQLGAGDIEQCEYDRIRYELRLAPDSDDGPVQIAEERVILLEASNSCVGVVPLEFFPMSPVVPRTLFS